MTGVLGTKLYAAFAALSAAVSLVMMALYVSPDSLVSVLLLVPFAIWIVGPHLFGWLIGLRFVEKEKALAAAVYLFLLVSSALSGFWIYIKVRFHDPPDAQSGLIFLTVPFFQWAFVMLAALPAILVGLLRR